MFVVFFEGAGSGFRVRRFLVLPSGFFFGGLGELGCFWVWVSRFGFRHKVLVIVSLFFDFDSSTIVKG